MEEKNINLFRFDPIYKKFDLLGLYMKLFMFISQFKVSFSEYFKHFMYHTFYFRDVGVHHLCVSLFYDILTATIT